MNFSEMKKEFEGMQKMNPAYKHQSSLAKGEEEEKIKTITAALLAKTKAL